ncbi:hypothetical protein SSX86_005891 [Deinandra increscens subsp. villosa]|uniref:Uncharacterized protein n=1 Tax=Deinandra increscens subsp. villosa TaxID=3103831 RepID=A0AAP0DMD9_9ASTR
MGNCMKKQPTVESDHNHSDDDWVTSQETKLLSAGNHRHDDSRKNKTTTVMTEVKIKISKKQLEELLGRTDVQGLTVKEVLARLMNASDRFESHQRSWRPALQSIPE